MLAKSVAHCLNLKVNISNKTHRREKDSKISERTLLIEFFDANNFRTEDANSALNAGDTHHGTKTIKRL